MSERRALCCPSPLPLRATAAVREGNDGRQSMGNTCGSGRGRPCDRTCACASDDCLSRGCVCVSGGGGVSDVCLCAEETATCTVPNCSWPLPVRPAVDIHTCKTVGCAHLRARPALAMCVGQLGSRIASARLTLSLCRRHCGACRGGGREPRLRAGVRSLDSRAGKADAW